MRQGNGSEILGAGNPRSAEIGIIHVSPLDDRQSVLAAILTQERLGRKQVVVVLPEDNKAFQRPIDFDGLKNKRRELQAEIIFVAPPGPGPAELARQRRFPVYSSLENYARSLQDTTAAQDQGSKGFRPGWLFARKQKQDTPATRPLPSPSGSPAPVILQPLTSSAPPQASISPAEATRDDFDDEQISADDDAMAMPVAQTNGTGMSGVSNISDMTDMTDMTREDEEDDPALPPIIPLPIAEPDPALAVHSATDDDLVNAGRGRGPNIIELSPRRTGTTGQIPAAQPDPQPINLPKKSDNSGKVAAVGTAAAPAAAFSARKSASTAAATGAGMSTATMAQTASGGNAIPPRSGTGGSGGPGRNTGRNVLIAAGLILLTLLLVVGGIAYADPGLLGHLSNVVPGDPNATTATVTITPAVKTIKKDYIITAVTGKPDSSAQQVQARILTDSPSQSQTVKATGVKQTTGTRATGTLTFYNGSTSEFTVAAYTVLSASGGVQVENTVAANIPAGSPSAGFGRVTVPAQAVNIGASGNIAAGAVNGTCCAQGNFITVTNLNAFSGGQDPQNYTFLQQSDVDAVATPLEQRLTSSAQANVEGQRHTGEQFINSGNPISCNPTVTANPPVGSKTTSATVTVEVSCAGEVYDQQGAQTLATNLYKSDSTIKPGSGFALTGNVGASLKTVLNVDKNTGTVTLQFEAQGTWVYQTSQLVAQEKTWAKQIAGKSKQQAIAFLQSQPGVGSVSIQFSGNTLPTDPGQITFVVQSVPVSSSPTPSGPELSPTPVTPSGGTPTSTPTPTNGLGSSN